MIFAEKKVEMVMQYRWENIIFLFEISSYFCYRKKFELKL